MIIMVTASHTSINLYPDASTFKRTVTMCENCPSAIVHLEILGCAAASVLILFAIGFARVLTNNAPSLNKGNVAILK